jgi:hypothetical protein
MTTINITNELSETVNAVPVNPDPASSLIKYVNVPGVNLQLLDSLIDVLAEPLDQAGASPLSTGLNFKDPVSLGSSKPELTISAAVTQSVNIYTKPGTNLLGSDPFGAGITVQADVDYMSLALGATVGLNLSGKDNDLTFGVNAGAGISAQFFRAFPTANGVKTVGVALGDLISHLVIPADLADIAVMGTDDIVTVSGTGSFGLSGGLSLSVTPNPLASPALPVVNQAVSVKASASLDLAGSFSVTGNYQIVVQKLSATSFEFGYYKSTGSQWDVSATLTGTASATLGSTDLIADLVEKITGKPEPKLQSFSNSGLTADELKQINDQLSAFYSTGLAASLKAEFSGSSSNGAVFLYRVDLSKLDASGSSAVHAALDGDLSQLTEMEAHADPQGILAPGITVIKSSMKTARERKSGITINLLGILNFGSVFDLMQNGETVFDPGTGELTINETVKGTSIKALLLPQAAQQLRRLRFNSILMTAAARVSGAVGSIQATSADVYFAQNASTNEHNVSDYLDAMIALGLETPAGKALDLAAFHGSGLSTCLIRVAFTDAACEAMFLTNGVPRKQSEYERIGRSVLSSLLLPPPGAPDADGYRRAVLDSDSIWSALDDTGNVAAFGTVPQLAGIKNDTVRLNVVGSDYITVSWWASNMAAAAKQLATVKSLVASGPTALNGNALSKQMEALRSRFAGVVANSQMHFDLPFGITALAAAAGSTAVPTGHVEMAGLTKDFARAMVAAA